MKKKLFPLFLLYLGVNFPVYQDFIALSRKDAPDILFDDF